MRRNQPFPTFKMRNRYEPGYVLIVAIVVTAVVALAAFVTYRDSFEAHPSIPTCEHQETHQCR